MKLPSCLPFNSLVMKQILRQNRRCTITPAPPGAGSPCWDLKGQLFALVQYQARMISPPPHWSHLRNANRCCAFKNDTWSPDSWFGQKPPKTDKNMESTKATHSPGSYIHRMWRAWRGNTGFPWGLKRATLPWDCPCTAKPTSLDTQMAMGWPDGNRHCPFLLTQKYLWLKTNKPQISSHLIWMRTQMREKCIYYNTTRNQTAKLITKNAFIFLNT